MLRSIWQNFQLKEWKIKKDRKGLTLYCFSPPVMIATFLIEMILAFYVLIQSIKYKSNVAIVITLVFLALFQLSEYQICEGSNPIFWTRIGLFVITFLPVLGIYLISKLDKDSKLLKIGFLIAIIIGTLFLLSPNSIKGATCGGNYIMFDVDSSLYSFFGYYYFIFLFLGIWKSIQGIKANHNKTKIKNALKWFVIGYLSFILPLTIVYILIPITRVAVASIMCGFAVIFAFILTFKIAPIYHECVKVDKKNKIQ